MILIISSTIIIFAGYFFFTNGKSLLRTNNYTNYVGEVTRVIDSEKTSEGMISTSVSVKILNKDLKGEEVVASQLSGGIPGYNENPINVGDKFVIHKTEDSIFLADHYRINGLFFLIALFFIGLLVLGKINGLKTIISLTITCGSIFMLFIPSIFAGYNIYVTSILTAVFIIITTLPLVSGYTKKSLAAAVGCIGGVLAVSLITLLMNKVLNLTGLSSQDSILLLNTSAAMKLPSFDLKALTFAAIILGALGATMDVAISIASSLFEFCKEVKDVTFKKSLTSGLIIGKDIMGTMTNTLILAYIGSSLTTILLLLMYGGDFSEILSKEIISTELLQSLAGSIGMLLTIPITAIIASYLYIKVKKVKSDREILNN